MAVQSHCVRVAGVERGDEPSGMSNLPPFIQVRQELRSVSVNSDYALLFEPLTFHAGDITLRNRLVLASMDLYSSDPDGSITAAELEFLRRRSLGVGMAITPGACVSLDGRIYDGGWICADDASIPILQEVARAIKSSGAVAVLQLFHGGRLSPAALLGHSPHSASAIRAEHPGADLPREMTEKEIEETIKAFGLAARRAIRAGFDGVEIRGAELPQQFFSPHSNRRSDQWGGSVENRAAFPIAVLEEVQEVVRRNAYTPFGIGYSIVPEEQERPGTTLSDSLQLVEGLAACRPDWIRVCVPDVYGGSRRDASDTRPQTPIIAEKVGGKTVVIGCGSITHPETAVNIIRDGAGLAALGRALLVDPEWVSRAVADEVEEIRHCLPASGGDEYLAIPSRLYARLLDNSGWLPICGERERRSVEALGGAVSVVHWGVDH
jgi:2,4-dienoyl-CoA reductase-like NADH-dependent reductase (Old Yellow Enzyme family)